MRHSRSRLALLATVAAGIMPSVLGDHTAKHSKRIDNGNLTPDAYYHNRYHALLAMAAYGDYETLCPQQTFTRAEELKNFPNATRSPWQVISNFGPTASGCEGFTVIVPEMNKALIVFKGNYKLEQSLSTESVLWSDVPGFGFNETACEGCKVNKFAVQGYMECKNQTNNWKAIHDAYAGQGLVFSIAGHGLGGMHSLIAAADLNHQNIAYYAHNYGAPRTFNQAGAWWYDARFNGEAAERGVANNDMYTEFIPAGPDYAHTGTGFYYSGYDPALTGPGWTYCFDGNQAGLPIVDDPGCQARDQTAYGFGSGTAAQDHYYYFTNVGQCGPQPSNQSTAVADAFIAKAQAAPAIGATSSPINVAGTTETGTSAAAGSTDSATKTGAAPVLQPLALSGLVLAAATILVSAF